MGICVTSVRNRCLKWGPITSPSDTSAGNFFNISSWLMLYGVYLVVVSSLSWSIMWIDQHRHSRVIAALNSYCCTQRVIAPLKELLLHSRIIGALRSALWKWKPTHLSIWFWMHSPTRGYIRRAFSSSKDTFNHLQTQNYSPRVSYQPLGLLRYLQERLRLQLLRWESASMLSECNPHCLLTCDTAFATASPQHTIFTLA